MKLTRRAVFGLPFAMRALFMRKAMARTIMMSSAFDWSTHRISVMSDGGAPGSFTLQALGGDGNWRDLHLPVPYVTDSKRVVYGVDRSGPPMFGGCRIK